MRRLLPDASRDDPQVAAEFRRLTEDDLRAGKIDAPDAGSGTRSTTPGRRAGGRDAFVVAPRGRAGRRRGAHRPAARARRAPRDPDRRAGRAPVRRAARTSPQAPTARGRADGRPRPGAPRRYLGRGLRRAELAAGVAGRRCCCTTCAPPAAPGTDRVSRPAVRLVRVNDAPIGIFDSGVGGLTVARSILDQLPHESILYIGDTLNTPVRPQAARGRARARARGHGRPGRRGREAAGHRVQHGVVGDAARRPRAVHAAARDPGGRGDPAGRPARGRRHPDGPDRRDRHASPRSSRASYDDAFAVAPGRRADDAGVPAVRASSSRRASRPGPRCSRSRTSTSTRSARPASTPSCSAARTTRCSPARSRTSWARRSRWSRAPRRPPRTSTARSSRTTWSATRAAGPPVHRFLATGDPDPFRILARRFLGPEVEVVEPQRGPAVRLTVLGCAGSFPGPDSAASCYLVQADDADGRTWTVLLDLGNGALAPCSGSATPPGSTRSACPTCTPTTWPTSWCSTSCGGTTRPAPLPPGAGARSDRDRRAARADVRQGPGDQHRRPVRRRRVAGRARR